MQECTNTSACLSHSQGTSFLQWLYPHLHKTREIFFPPSPSYSQWLAKVPPCCLQRPAPSFCLLGTQPRPYLEENIDAIFSTLTTIKGEFFRSSEKKDLAVECIVRFICSGVLGYGVGVLYWSADFGSRDVATQARQVCCCRRWDCREDLYDDSSCEQHVSWRVHTYSVSHSVS